jgi:D-aminopeptidase
MTRTWRALGLLLLLPAAGRLAGDEPASRPRLRALGVAPGVLPPGPLDAITDVEGVRVGHRTLLRGADVRTGVTVVLAHGGNLFQEKVPAAAVVGNGFGKAAGWLQVQELGVLESPVVLTNTLAVGTAVVAVVEWTLAQPGNEEVRSVNAVVGETNDGFLNDIRGLHVGAADVRAALAAARPGEVEEGSVGAGTGTLALGWKGGIGTASRRLPEALGGFTLGALVQSNFDGVLTVAGVPVGEELGRFAFRESLAGASPPGPGDGSCMIVLATDAPLSPRNLERLARRGLLGLARVGSFMSHGSGDFVLAFSTSRRVPHTAPAPIVTLEELRDEGVSPLFLAAVEAVEEAIYNSLTRATTVVGHRGRRAEAIPLDRLRQALERYGRIRPAAAPPAPRP